MVEKMNNWKNAAQNFLYVEKVIELSMRVDEAANLALQIASAIDESVIGEDTLVMQFLSHPEKKESEVIPGTKIQKISSCVFMAKGKMANITAPIDTDFEMKRVQRYYNLLDNLIQ